MDECDNPEKTWHPQRVVCRKTMDLAAVDWFFEQKHKDAPFHDGTFESWSKERTSSHPHHFRDGVRVWLSDVDLAQDDSWWFPDDDGRAGLDDEVDDN